MIDGPSGTSVAICNACVGRYYTMLGPSAQPGGTPVRGVE
jgi:hypothetical protein